MYVRTTYMPVTLRNVNCDHTQEFISQGHQWRTEFGEEGDDTSWRWKMRRTAGPSQRT